jgi:malonyl-CoA/methylmalonyl-CoA synthetase
MSIEMDNHTSAETLTDLLSDNGWSMESQAGRTSAARFQDLSLRFAEGLSGRTPGSAVLVCTSDPVVTLAVAMGGWWNDLRVAFWRRDSPLRLSDQLKVSSCSLAITDTDTDFGIEAEDADLTAMSIAHSRLIADTRMAGPSRARPDHAALTSISSGTTGKPKCVEFSHAAMAANVRALAHAMQIGPEDRLWTCVPVGLSGTLCTVALSSALTGATAIVHSDILAADARRILPDSNPTVVYAVPEIYEVLARGAGTVDSSSLSSCRLWLSSSGVLRPELFDRMEAKWGARVRSFYCASEIGTATFNDADDLPTLRSSVGRPLAGVRLGIEPVEGLPPERGRVVVGGALIATSYRDESLVSPVSRDGMVAMTDLGEIDSRGYLHLHGRLSASVRVGAAIVDPDFVRERLLSVHGIHDCEVVGVPHRFLGEALEARVVPESGTVLDEKSVIAALRDMGLQGAWVPRSVKWLESTGELSQDIDR